MAVTVNKNGDLILCGEIKYGETFSEFMSVAPEAEKGAHFYIHSYGGSVTEAMAIAQIMQAVPLFKTFHTIGCGVLASSAVLIWAAGDGPKLFYGTALGIHGTTSDMDGASISELQQELRFLDMVNQFNYDVINKKFPALAAMDRRDSTGKLIRWLVTEEQLTGLGIPIIMPDGTII